MNTLGKIEKPNCKLCNDNDANQKNSHIVSKFLGIDMFGDKSKRTGFVNRPDCKPQKVQDLPKEDFLYCKSCERKFNTIETIIAKALTKKTKEEFDENYNRVGTIGIESIKATNEEILLFFYVNFLRLHDSSLEGLEEFQLDDKNYQKIKQTILFCLSEKLSETREQIVSAEFNYIPMTIMTTDYEKDPSENFFSVNQTTEHKIGLLVCSNWMIHFYERESAKNDEKMSFSKYHVNSENKKFMCSDKDMWDKINETVGKGMINKYDFKLN